MFLERKEFHPEKHISLNDYKGVGKEFLGLDSHVADGFMSVSDMRRDISIVQKPQERTRDYDQIGYVRVAKFLSMPTFESWKKHGNVQVRKEEGVWLVAVDDQEVAQNVARSTENGKFNEKFISQFGEEVKKGLGTCLKQEKLLNSGKYDTAFGMSYIDLMFKDLPIASLELLALSYIKDVSTDVRFTAIMLAYTAFHHAFFNGMNKRHAIDVKIPHGFLENLFSSNEDPFIKKNILELFTPCVPIDRLVRGSFFLKRHGGKLIRKEE